MTTPIEPELVERVARAIEKADKENEELNRRNGHSPGTCWNNANLLREVRAAIAAIPDTALAERGPVTVESLCLFETGLDAGALDERKKIEGWLREFGNHPHGGAENCPRCQIADAIEAGAHDRSGG